MSAYESRESNILIDLARAKADMLSLKNAQRSGGDVLITKVSDSPLYYSEPFYGVGSPTETNQILYKTVVFKADRQTSPFGKINIILTNNNSNQRVFALVFQPTEVNDGILKWTIEIRANPYVQFSAKYRVSASDSGTVIAGPVII